VETQPSLAFESTTQQDLLASRAGNVQLKTLFALLLLYVCLVWVWAAYRHPDDLVKFGLFWTACGLITLLVGIVGARLVAAWRLWRAKAALRPATPLEMPRIVNEDETSVAALIAEANAALAKSPAHAQIGRNTIFGMPLYLLVGAENSGKTSTFLNAGLEPQLLAGQADVSGFASSNVPCSLWLVKDAIFAEMSGRLFSGDLTRWTQVLKALRAEQVLPSWRSLWEEPSKGLILNGVFAFCDVKEFTGAPDVEASERRSRQWQEKLGAIGEQFGMEFPVYQVITKSDAIPYFSDFFRRLSESEAKQVFGYTQPLRGGRPARENLPEEETKRLTRSFRSLYISISKRRITHLAHEPDPARRSEVYEFPREFNRVRVSLVQFLVATFRPQPLGFGPVLRGYYLTGVREVEVTSVAAKDTRPDWSGPRVKIAATSVFSADATRIFHSDQAGKQEFVPGRLSTQRMFVTDLFRSVATNRTQKEGTTVNHGLETRRRIVFASLCAICTLICLFLLSSWIGNRRLLDEVAGAVSTESQKHNTTLSVAELQSLENLRFQVARLTSYEREGPPLGLRWGLYSGGSLLEVARATYFRRFQELILGGLNNSIVAHLQELPVKPGPSDPYEPAYSLLKAHLMISSGRCSADSKFLNGFLKEAIMQTGIAVEPDEQTLINRQIDLYAQELPYGITSNLIENANAVDHAREYLRNLMGIDRIYASILANVEKSLAKPQQLRDLAPNYDKVLNGSGEVSPVFSQEGWKLVEKASKEKNNVEGLGEACVVGDSLPTIGEKWNDAAITKEIQRRFITDYIRQWKNFVAGFSVARYGSAEDAARKLEILSGHGSPLLAVLAMTANKTEFSNGSTSQSYLENKAPVISNIIKAGRKAQSVADKVETVPDGVPAPSTADITRSFQPVHWVVPPNSDQWVSTKNAAYIDALSQLQHSMEAIAHDTNNPDPSVHQAADLNRQKAMNEAEQIARGFKPIGVEGVDIAVQRLLDEPIELTKPFIINNIGLATAGTLNGQLHALCNQLRSTTQRYPFNSASIADTSLQDLTNAFAPASGAVWKFQAQSLSEYTIKDGSVWKAKDPAKKPQVTPGMLAFLNRAQAITDAFYPSGATQPQLIYILRPKLDSSFGTSTLEFDIDGHSYQWTSSLQKQFAWPPPADTKNLGAVAKVNVGGLSFPFASRPGLWGVFRIMGDAEPRALGSKIVEWRYITGGNGQPAPIQPAPVRVEFVQFPAGFDVFNPRFFDGLQCPGAAVQ
jgi:type VI secretion system protein ImpL